MASFVASARHVDIRQVVLTANESARSLADVDVDVVVVPAVGDRDDRFRLVEHAFRHLKSDFLWFVDDDDWLFPNDAELISLALALAPPNSPIFVDSQHFTESGSLGTESGALPLLHSTPGRRFPASDLLRSLSGHNHTPFCSVILSRATLLSLPPDVIQRITYFEDFTLILHALLQPGVTPVTVSTLAAGISVRDEGQSVVATDRTVWNLSMAELTVHLVDDTAASLLSLPEVFLRSSAREVAEFKTQLAQLRQRSERLEHERDRALYELERVSRSLSWRLARPFRGAHKILTRTAGPAK